MPKVIVKCIDCGKERETRKREAGLPVRCRECHLKYVSKIRYQNFLKK